MTQEDIDSAVSALGDIVSDRCNRGRVEFKVRARGYRVDNNNVRLYVDVHDAGDMRLMARAEMVMPAVELKALDKCADRIIAQAKKSNPWFMATSRERDLLQRARSRRLAREMRKIMRFHPRAAGRQ